MNIVDNLNRFEALIRSSEYMEYAHRWGAEYDDTCAKIAAARAEILSAFKQATPQGTSRLRPLGIKS